MNKEELIEEIERRMRLCNMLHVLSFGVSTEEAVPKEWREDICLHFKDHGHVRFDDAKKLVWLERKSLPL